MKGIYHVIVQNRYLKYEFDVRRNLTIVQGNSATGKTTLVEMIRESHLDCELPVNLRLNLLTLHKYWIFYKNVGELIVVNTH